MIGAQPATTPRNQMNDIFTLEGKVALVTGGSRGIGEMIARGLVRAGVRTYIASRSAEACDETAAALNALGGGECIAIPADLSKMEGINSLAQALKSRERELHILINNAGTAWGEPFESYSEKGWDKVMDLNLKGVFFLTQQLRSLLEAAGRAHDPARIVNVGSVEGLHVPTYDTFAYGLSKAAVHHLTKLLAKRLAPANINVNAIAPGPFDTRMMEWAITTIRDEIEAKVPRGRLGQASDLVGTITYLCSCAGAYVTGSVIPLDGGLTTTL